MKNFLQCYFFSRDCSKMIQPIVPPVAHLMCRFLGLGCRGRDRLLVSRSSSTVSRKTLEVTEKLECLSVRLVLMTKMEQPRHTLFGKKAATPQ